MLRAVRIAVLLCIVCATYLHAQVFHDDFDGTSLDPAKWTIAGGGTVAVAGGFATLSSTNGDMFPYVTSVTNSFPPTGDFLIRVGFRYPDPRLGGNGFGSPNGLVIGNPGVGFWVWQDQLIGGGLRAACGDNLVQLAPAPETNYHVYEWRCIGTTYSFYVDAQLVATDASKFRPNGFFFGHPTPFTYCCGWTTQEIDFVHIEAGNLTPARASSWGRVKALYR